MNKLTLPALPYSYDALEPVISSQIMTLHHDKHHLAYVNGANSALEKLEKARKGELELNYREVMRDFSFHYNGAKLHELFWENMRPASENNRPTGELLESLTSEFGSFEAFQKEFLAAANQVEGSGWAVLWKNNVGKMFVGQLEKHNLLGLNDCQPILVLDVWEHAYYLQYLNNKAEYVEKWWQVVNWEDVAKRS